MDIFLYLCGMKKILLLLLLTFTLNGQNVNFNKFNNSHFNKILFRKINQYRLSQNLDTLLYSKVSEKIVSKQKIEHMIQKSKCFHPEFNFFDTLYTNQLAKEYKILVTKTNPSFFDVNYLKPYENAYSTNVVNVTYEQLADMVLQAWLKSPAHSIPLNKKLGTIKHPGICSCYLGVGKNNEKYCIFNCYSINYFD